MIEKIIINDKTYHFVLCAHVSKKSVEEVVETIQTVEPDCVCVELDQKRQQNLMNPIDYSQIKLFEVIKNKKFGFLVATTILSQYQKKMADQLETKVGDEMKYALIQAQQQNIPTKAIDRDITTTFKRIWSHLNLWDKCKLVYVLISSMFSNEEISVEEIEKLKQQDLIQDALKEMGNSFEKVTNILVYERDQYMASHLLDLNYKNIVVVIGAAHGQGIINLVKQQKPIDREPLTIIKKPNPITKVILFLIPIILTIFIITNITFTSFSYWMIGVSLASGLGALICLAHPITILVAILAAPISTLSPVLAVGWFVGLSEAFFKSPNAADFINLSDDATSIKKALKNNILRVLIIMFMTSLFSAIVTIFFSYSALTNWLSKLF